MYYDLPAEAVIKGKKYKEEELMAIPLGTFTYEEFKNASVNSAAISILCSKMDNEALKEVVKCLYLPHAKYRRNGATYNDILMGTLLPELLKRL